MAGRRDVAAGVNDELAICRAQGAFRFNVAADVDSEGTLAAGVIETGGEGFEPATGPADDAGAGDGERAICRAKAAGRRDVARAQAAGRRDVAVVDVDGEFAVRRAQAAARRDVAERRDVAGRRDVAVCVDSEGTLAAGVIETGGEGFEPAIGPADVAVAGDGERANGERGRRQLPGRAIHGRLAVYDLPSHRAVEQVEFSGC